MTDKSGTASEPKGRVLYDGECAFCTGLARRFGPALRHRGFELAPQAERRSQMELVKTDGRILGGADAVIELARQIWWGWPLWVLAQMPGSRSLLHVVYRWIAARRYCLGGMCERPATRSAGGSRVARTFLSAVSQAFQPAGLSDATRGTAQSVHKADRNVGDTADWKVCATALNGSSSRLEACATGTAWIGWVVVLAMAVAAFWVRDYLPAWVFMWALALAIFAGCKWVTWRKVRRGAVQSRSSRREPAHFFSRKDQSRVTSTATLKERTYPCLPSWFRSVGYLVGWVGMDAEAFLGSPGAAFWRSGTISCRSRREEAQHSPRKDQSLLTSAATSLMECAVMPARKEWWLAGLKTCFGEALVWGGVRMVPPDAALVQGWVGLVGLVFLLHFGLFHLLALAWQRAGVDAQPIMRAPILATSISEFWGERWNKAFHQLAHEIAFRPLRRTLGPPLATLAVFSLSGIVHEAVISLPARDGYGLPTGYFLLQGLALLGERSRIGRHLGLGRGWRGWLWTFVWTAGPAPILFHPPFIHKVILPFLKVIGAL